MNPVRSVAFHNEIAPAKALIADGDLTAGFIHPDSEAQKWRS
jgi:hypothetical protein